MQLSYIKVLVPLILLLGPASAAADPQDKPAPVGEVLGTDADPGPRPLAPRTPRATRTPVTPPAARAPASTPTPPPATPPAPRMQTPNKRTRELARPMPADKPNLSRELVDQRAFEQQTFPRPIPARLRPGRVHKEPATPRRKGPRPSALYPPPGLRSEAHGARGKRAGQGQPRVPPAHAWLSKLTLPDIPVRWDPKVIRFLEFYRSSRRGRAIMSLWLKRMGRYRTMMSRTLKKHGVPQSLIYVSMMESGFSPLTTSRVGAAGLWQFMPGPGRWFGLNRDYWVDERRNPDLSTEAGVKMLKHLHNRFKSWELALAAYNAGHGAVIRAMQKYNTNDYWRLCSYEAGLPWGTTIYVPKIMALAVVGQNRAYFGYSAKPDPELTFDVVAVSTSVTMAQAARAAGGTEAQLKLLNPELRRGRTPPRIKSWIRVPRGTKARFYAGLARIKGRLAAYKPYTVRLGETDASIAERHGITKKALRRINKIRSAFEVRPGITILVPARTPPKALLKKKKPPPRVRKRQGKKKGAVAPKDDDRILVALPRNAPTRIKGRRRVFYRVVLGDILPRVAMAFGVTEVQLAHWNGLNPSARLVSTMVLQIFVKKSWRSSKVVLQNPKRLRIMVAGSPEFLNFYERRKGRRRLTYTVRKGDTIKSVGRRLGLTVGDVIRINGISRWSKLKAGQKLVVYVEESRLRKLKRKKRRKKARRRAAPRRASKGKKLKPVRAVKVKPVGKLGVKVEKEPSPKSRASKRKGKRKKRRTPRKN